LGRESIGESHGVLISLGREIICERDSRQQGEQCSEIYLR